MRRLAIQLTLTGSSPKNVLEIRELYYGNVHPFERDIKKDSESDRLAKLVLRHDAALKATMNEHETQTTQEATTDGTIVITRSEYAYLIAESAKNDLLKDYVNSREYLDKDVVRAILGMYRSEESEG